MICAFCIIQVFVYMYLILGPEHSRREFVLTLKLLWATIIDLIHRAQPAVGDTRCPVNPKKNFFLNNKRT